MDNTLMSLLYPLHPKLVHVPIALVISAMGLQALGMLFKKDAWCKGAWMMFILGTVAMPIAILSGLQEAERLHLHHPVLSLHKQFVFLAMGVSLAALPVLWFIRSKKILQIVFLVVLVAISGLLTFAAHQGGRMVYEYGVGVSQ